MIARTQFDLACQLNCPCKNASSELIDIQWGVLYNEIVCCQTTAAYDGLLIKFYIDMVYWEFLIDMNYHVDFNAN